MDLTRPGTPRTCALDFRLRRSPVLAKLNMKNFKIYKNLATLGKYIFSEDQTVGRAGANPPNLQ